MILRLICPSGHVLDVDAKLAGRKIRCGACGKIMLVPAPPQGANRSGPARPARKPLPRQAVKPQAAPEFPAKPLADVPVKQEAAPEISSKPLAVETPATQPVITRLRKPYEAELPRKPQVAKANVELPPAASPAMAREAEMVSIPLPPPPPAPAAEPRFHQAPMPRRNWGMVFRDWFRDRLPARPTHLPADVTEPGPEQRQTALRLAIAVAAPAVLSLLPVVLSGHANLLAAPPWALWAVLLAVVQLIYAGWMVNAPDWASARVQMIVCAAATTIYAMAMTLVLITPVNRPLILGLGEARRLAPGWCGVMFLLLGVATWYCGRTSARWRNKVPSPSGRGLG